MIRQQRIPLNHLKAHSQMACDLQRSLEKELILASKRFKWALSAVLAGVLALAAAMGYHMLNAARTNSFAVSCDNHENFLRVALSRYQLANDGALPYEQGMPGYSMFCRFSAKNTEGHVNCNHGAPNSRIGGWQAVNLPPAKWDEVRERWQKYREDKPIPFAWCGKPTHAGTRVVICTGLLHFNKAEEDIQKSIDLLNRILDEMGEPPVQLNVPDDVNWSRWEGTKKE